MASKEPETHGWKFYKTCSCGGNYQEWFTKTGLTLVIFPHNNKFKVTQRGKQIRTGTLAELQNYYQEGVTV